MSPSREIFSKGEIGPKRGGGVNKLNMYGDFKKNSPLLNLESRDIAYTK